jgi:hypothetical protein
MAEWSVTLNHLPITAQDFLKFLLGTNRCICYIKFCPIIYGQKSYTTFLRQTFILIYISLKHEIFIVLGQIR